MRQKEDGGSEITKWVKAGTVSMRSISNHDDDDLHTNLSLVANLGALLSAFWYDRKNSPLELERKSSPTSCFS